MHDGCPHPPPALSPSTTNPCNKQCHLISVRSVDGRRCRRAWSQPATARDRDRVCHGDHRSCATCQGFPMAAASLLTIGSFKPYGKPAAWLGCGAAPLRDWWIWMTKEVSAQSGSENISGERQRLHCPRSATSVHGNAKLDSPSYVLTIQRPAVERFVQAPDWLSFCCCCSPDS